MDITAEEILGELAKLQLQAPQPGDVTTRMVIDRLGTNKHTANNWMHRLARENKSYRIVKVIDTVTALPTNALRKVAHDNDTD